MNLQQAIASAIGAVPFQKQRRRQADSDAGGNGLTQWILRPTGDMRQEIYSVCCKHPGSARHKIRCNLDWGQKIAKQMSMGGSKLIFVRSGDRFGVEARRDGL